MRLLKEYVSQVVWIGSSILDRLFLTYVLLRVWGVEQFENWSLIVSLAGLVSLADFGMSLHFSNVFARLKESDDHPQLEAALATAQFLFALLAAGGLLVLAGYVWLQQTAMPPGGALALLALSAATASRIAVTGLTSLFRAYKAYATFMAWIAAGEYLRIGLAAALAFMGYGILAVGIASAVVTVVLQCIIPAVLATRLSGFARWFAMTSSRAVHHLLLSLPFFLQSVPTTLLAALPVVWLGHVAEGTGVIATFVAVRTFTSFPRAILQQASVIFGMEAARCHFAGDAPAMTRVVGQAGRFVNVSSGAIAGVLALLAPAVLKIWTSGQVSFNQWHVAAGLLPMVLASHSTLVHNVLVCVGRATEAAKARFLQLGCVVLAFVLLPLNDMALRLLLALSVGEVVGFGLWGRWMMADILSEAPIGAVLRDTAWALAGAAVVVVPGMLITQLPMTENQYGQFAVFAWAIAGSLVATLVVGIDKAWRHRLLSILQGKH